MHKGALAASPGLRGSVLTQSQRGAAASVGTEPFDSEVCDAKRLAWFEPFFGVGCRYVFHSAPLRYVSPRQWGSPNPPGFLLKRVLALTRQSLGTQKVPRAAANR